MKRIHLLLVLLIPMMLNGQKPSNDLNWNTTPVYEEEFMLVGSHTTRSWDFQRHDDNTWNMISYLSDAYGGVLNFEENDTCGKKWEQQIYQMENAVFNTTSPGYMTLKAVYTPGYDTTHPNFWSTYKDKNPIDCPYDYVSGAIQVIEPFRYGYFEIKCALPAHNYGNFPAFWLWSKTETKYNEIDVFEHIKRYNIPAGQNGNANDLGSAYDDICIHGTFYETKVDTPRVSFQMMRYYLQTGEQPLTSMHTYAIEWSPKMIIWYFDGKPIGEVYNHNEVTDQAMKLMANLAIAGPIEVIYRDKTLSSEMKIDYIKVYKLKCNCTQDVNVTSTSQLNTMTYSVKRNINIANTGTVIQVQGTGKTFRATNEITINGNFEIPLGTEFYAITHACPE